MKKNSFSLKKIKIVALILVVLILIVVVVFLCPRFLRTRGVSQAVFTQNNWSGGIGSEIAELPNDSSGWNSFSAATSGIDYLAENEVKLVQNYVKFKENGLLASAEAGDQYYHNMVSDGAGGSIIVWLHDNNGASYNIRAQRIDSLGNILWTEGGVSITSEGEYIQAFPDLVADDSGGAFIVWMDERNQLISGVDIYVQKIDSFGVAQWQPGGIAITEAENIQGYSRMITDGLGGVIIVWEDHRTGVGKRDIYAQKVSSDGVLQWDNNGLAISVVPDSDQEVPRLVSDGSGGAIIVWADYRNGNYDIYAQRINSSGIVQWENNGVAISTIIGDQNYPVIVADDSGGAIIAWMDERNGDVDIYAQRINSSGAVQWGNKGLAVSSVSDSDQELPQMISDGSGGAIIVWADNRGDDYDIYAQRIDSDGTSQWLFNGILVSSGAGNQSWPFIAPDIFGGAIITWEDSRDSISSGIDIYAQKINGDGERLWDAGNDDFSGIVVCSATGDQNYPVVVSDNMGGAVTSWWDFRDDQQYDIYVQAIGSINGIFISSVIDTGRYNTWDRIESDAEIPEGTLLSFQTRVSENNETWSLWEDLGFNNIIQSPAGRYIQYKVIFEAKELLSPTLYSISIFSDPLTYPSMNPGTVTITDPTIEVTDSDLIDFSNGIISVVNPEIAVVGGTEVILSQEVQIDTGGDDLVITNSDLGITIPDKTIISGDDDWDGTINPPTYGTLEKPPANFRFGNMVISVGSSDSILVFDRPVLITVNNLTNQGVPSLRYKAPGLTTWIQVPKCSGIFTLPIMPDSYGECYIFDGVDTLNIWTWHFTTFATLVSSPAYSPLGSEEISEEIPAKSEDLEDVPIVTTEDTLALIQLSPIPPFNPNWGSGYFAGRTNWALDHRVNIYQLYVILLERKPTATEVNWWLQYSPDINFIRYLFLNSDEYANKNK